MKTCVFCKCEINSCTQIGQKKFCSSKCRRALRKETYQKMNPRPLINPNKTGVLSEMLVCCDLIKRNCDVYRQLASNSCDLAIIYKDKFLKVEVTTGYLHPSGNITNASKDRSKFDVLAIVVNGSISYVPDIFDDQTQETK